MKKLLFILLFLFTVINYAYADKGTLLVGTTGDYPPLTYKSESGYDGDDIQIIRKFAADNGWVIKFVPTSWPHLSQDLAANKFMVAVGGISINPERSRQFLFSTPLGHSAKAPLIRCDDMARFPNFAAIDQESIVVVENRGGTNQAFALNNIKHATLLLVPENLKALSKLTESNSNVNVMFTDDIEIDYRHQLNPRLCRANIPEKFAVTTKVFLFTNNPNGKQLQQQFNYWWSSQSAK